MVEFFLPVFPPFFVFFFNFILSTIAFQRVRVNGTLERLMVAPIKFGEIIGGYIGGFLLFTTVQSIIVVSYVLVLISFPITVAQIGSIALITLLMMLIGLMLGLFASFLAHNEFQAVQFIPLVILPQIFLSDMIWDIKSFPLFFKHLSEIYCQCNRRDRRPTPPTPPNATPTARLRLSVAPPFHVVLFASSPCLGAAW